MRYPDFENYYVYPTGNIYSTISKKYLKPYFK